MMHNVKVNGFSPKMGPDQECKVSDGLFIIMFVGRFLGVSPVAFRRHGGCYRARYSHCSMIAGYLLISVSCILAICNLVCELQEDEARAIRSKGGMTTAVWVVEQMIFIAICGVGVFGAQGRTRQLIQILAEKEKLDSQLTSFVEQKPAKTSTTGLAVYGLLFTLILEVLDFYEYYTVDSNDHSDIYVDALRNFFYSFFYVTLFITSCHLLVFALVACAVRDTIRMLNAALKQQICCLEGSLTNEAMFGYKEVFKYNKIVDTMALPKLYKEDPIDRLETVTKSIIELKQLHGKVMRLPQVVNDIYGLIVVLLLGILLLHLVETPYYLITFTATNEILASRYVFHIIMLVVWMIYHICSLITIVEPCHNTSIEVSHTSELVAKLLLLAPANYEPLSRELLTLSSILAITSFQYSPMGMCDFSRMLMTNIMGAVTTYLVIMVQFQMINEQIAD